MTSSPPPHERRHGRPQLQDPDHQENGLLLPEPRALQDCHLLPLWRPRPLPGHPRRTRTNHFFKVPEIRLYWMAIALVAQMLAAPLDALTVVVLTHELAHAYSHLGRDIDGRRWETDAFAKTDLSIAEGIAPVLHGGRQLEGRDAISGGCRGLSDAPQAPDGAVPSARTLGIRRRLSRRDRSTCEPIASRPTRLGRSRGASAVSP